MARILLYYAHPGHRKSNANKAMWRAVRDLEGVTPVDLYAEYPRLDINIEREQQRLLDHDLILFQFPLFWYSTPSILKEWQDLVLEHGFAYGDGGTALKDKRMMLAITAAGPAEAYTPKGYQHFPLRTFLSPLEQTAGLCKMTFETPYVLFSSLKAPKGAALDLHVDGYKQLITSLQDDSFDSKAAAKHDLLHHDTLPIVRKA